ncbi:MAG: DUF6252 family protein [Christiangramia sp.]|uniref:DUF6252 family protein n=1 Tax=Christiangramia sp. TaxID=1931228 RepID=UPI000C6AA4DB|nr:hypothetical protein [Christiangramia sp.]
MKTVKLHLKVFAFFLLISVALTSCSGDDENGAGDGGGKMTAKIEGKDFESFAISSNAVKSSSNGGTMLFLQGTNSDGIGITMTIMGYDGEGTYQFGPVTSNFNTASYTETNISNPMNTQVWSASYDTSSSGSVTISEETDSGVKGTFQFKGKNGNDDSIKTISGGEFDLNFKS